MLCCHLTLSSFLANQVQSNIRELEGALNQLSHFVKCAGLQPDLQIVQGLFGAPLTPKARFWQGRLLSVPPNIFK